MKIRQPDYRAAHYIHHFKLLSTMNLEQKVMAEMKDAMKSKGEATLRALRAIKAEIIKTDAAAIVIFDKIVCAPRG